MQHDKDSRQMNFVSSEWSMLGLPAGEPMTRPDSDVHSLIRSLTALTQEADDQFELNESTGIDPLVQNGLLGDHVGRLTLYAELSAVRNVVEDREPTDEERVRIQLRPTTSPAHLHHKRSRFMR